MPFWKDLFCCFHKKKGKGKDKKKGKGKDKDKKKDEKGEKDKKGKGKKKDKEKKIAKSICQRLRKTRRCRRIVFLASAAFALGSSIKLPDGTLPVLIKNLFKAAFKL